jgi:protein SCO1/2
VATNKRIGFIIALIIVLIFPLVFFLYFDYLHKHRTTLETDKCLPIFGPKEPYVTTDEKGHKKTDTAYFHVPPFSFLDQNGDTVTESIMHGKIVVADFFFTTCKSICIDMTRNLKRVQSTFEKEERRDVLILSHTVDPETDSVGQLFKYSVEKEINSNVWRLLTGDKKEIYKMARYGYFITAMQGDGGPTDFIHDQKFVLIDKEGRIRGYYNGTEDATVDRMIKDIQTLLVSYIVPMKSNTPRDGDM